MSDRPTEQPTRPETPPAESSEAPDPESTELPPEPEAPAPESTELPPEPEAPAPETTELPPEPEAPAPETKLSAEPTEAPEPAEPESAELPTEPTEAPEPGEPEPTEPPAEPTEAPEPGEPEPTELPAEPTEAPEPAEPREPTEPAEQAEPREPESAEQAGERDAPEPAEAREPAEAALEPADAPEAPEPAEAPEPLGAPESDEAAEPLEAAEGAEREKSANPLEAPDPSEPSEELEPDASEAPDPLEDPEVSEGSEELAPAESALLDEAPEPVPMEETAESADPVEARKQAAQADGLIDEAGRVPVTELESGERVRGWPCDDTGYQIRNDDLEYLGLDEKQVGAWQRFEAPLGMSPEQFEGFTGSLKEALAADGIDPDQVDIRLQGSSAQFFSGSHKDFPTEQDLAEQPDAAARLQGWMGDRPEADRPARIPFDAKHLLGVMDEKGIPEPPSDYDIQLSSDAMVDKARNTWESTDPGTRSPHLIHPKYDFVNKEVAAQSFPALQDWKANWEGELGREVAPALFPSAGPPDRTDVGSGISTHFRESDWIINRPGGDDRE